MSGWSVAWSVWVLAFALIEGFALAVKDTPGHPATLSAHVWWLISGAGLWHHLARLGLLFGLVWLTVHLLTRGWV